MIKAELTEKNGYKFCFKITCGGEIYYGGLTDSGELTADAACPYKEFMLRVLVNKCMNDYVREAATGDIWGVDLEKFGFRRSGGKFVCGFYDFKLPHDCTR